MAQGEAEYGCARGEQPPLLGDQDEQPTAFNGKPMRWVCGAVPAGAEVAPGTTGPGVPASGMGAPELSADDGVVDRVAGGLVPRQRAGEPADSEELDDPDCDDPRRASACQPDRPGWAGGHRHGAVRPRVRGDRRERPPDRWC
jgi:hypothetical protein